MLIKILRRRASLIMITSWALQLSISIHDRQLIRETWKRYRMTAVFMRIRINIERSTGDTWVYEH